MQEDLAVAVLLVEDDLSVVGVTEEVDLLAAAMAVDRILLEATLMEALGHTQVERGIGHIPLPHTEVIQPVLDTEVIQVLQQEQLTTHTISGIVITLIHMEHMGVGGMVVSIHFGDSIIRCFGWDMTGMDMLGTTRTVGMGQ